MKLMRFVIFLIFTLSISGCAESTIGKVNTQNIQTPNSSTIPQMKDTTTPSDKPKAPEVFAVGDTKLAPTPTPKNDAKNEINSSPPQIEKNPTVEIPKPKVSTKKLEEITTVNDLVEYINSHTSELLIGNPGAIGVGATYRTVIWFNKGIKRDISDASTDTLTLSVNIENLVEDAGSDKIDLRGFSLLNKENEIPSKFTLDKSNHSVKGGLMPKGWPVTLKIVFDIPTKSELSEYKLRLYDGKDHVDLKLTR